MNLHYMLQRMHIWKSLSQWHHAFEARVLDDTDDPWVTSFMLESAKCYRTPTQTVCHGRPILLSKFLHSDPPGRELRTPVLQSYTSSIS
jgi:hypothetical protein